MTAGVPRSKKCARDFKKVSVARKKNENFNFDHGKKSQLADFSKTICTPF